MTKRFYDIQEILPWKAGKNYIKATIHTGFMKYSR